MDESVAQKTIVGTRIRQRRKELSITQAELAGEIGISASYLNLIEWNKRRITPTLLTKLSQSMGMPPGELDGSGESRLLDSLREVALLPALSGVDIEDGRTGELVGRFPGWARGIAALARSERDAIARARTLSDRLSNDPFLSETVHKMLTRIAAIRSAADILTDYHDLPTERRKRFDGIIQEESSALSDVGEALARYLDKTEDTDRVLTPLDEVEALFETRGNRFGELDQACEPLSSLLTDPRAMSRRASAAALASQHLQPVVDSIIAKHTQIKTSAARARARRALSDYAVNAILMPIENFNVQAQRTRYDIETLADVFSVDIAAVCYRLTALPAGERIPRFGYLRANAAGTIIEMLGLEGLAIPRYAAACPLWALYRAQQSPETVIRQRALFPNGSRFVFIARARHSGPGGFGKPRNYITDMLSMREQDAQFTVYSPDRSAPVEEVGPNCRLCPRRACIHRVEDPLAD